MLLGKQLATVSATADDTVRRIEGQLSLVREEFDVGVTMLVVAIATLTAAVLLGSFVIASARR